MSNKEGAPVKGVEQTISWCRLFWGPMRLQGGREGGTEGEGRSVQPLRQGLLFLDPLLQNEPSDREAPGGLGA